MNRGWGLVLVAAAALAGCKDNTMMNNPPPDMSMMMMQNKDMTMMMMNMGDMSMPAAMCQPDPMMDGMQCINNGCPQGLIAVGDQNGTCHCWYTCTPDVPNSCPCGRNCNKLFMMTDAGNVPSPTGACLHANGAGERCGEDANKMPFHYGNCQDGTLCVNEDQAGMYAFCMYKCTNKPGDCPAETTCLGLQMGGSVCAIQSSDQTNLKLGDACTAQDVCPVNSLCDGTCKPGCNGPWDKTTCMNNTTCTAISDPKTNDKIAGYVCK
jgi:hypothetical protein